MITIDFVTENDLEGVYNLVYELAVYEKAPDQVITNPQILKEGFQNKFFNALIAKEDKKIVGIALYYFGFSTWCGKMLYLDDFVVTDEHRGKGIGKMLLDRLMVIAKEENAKQIRWHVLEWNKPAINFYKKFPVKFDGEWITCKVNL